MDAITALPCQDGRVFIVTGANTGLGFETTRALAEKGATVILACRSLAKADSAIESIRQQVPEANLQSLALDLSSLKSVRQFAETFLSGHDRLDVLINNAGVMMPPYTKTEDGLELQFQANFLGHFLLTGLLLDRLTSTPGSRVVTLSSIAHRNGSIDFSDLQSEQSYSASKAYGQSKLACLLFTFELQRRLEKAGYTQTLSTGAHPGVAITELVRHMPSWIFALARYTFVPLFTHSPEAGARPTLLAAIGDAQGGDYFGPTGFREMKGPPGKATATEMARDEALAARLWDEAERLVGLSYPSGSPSD